MDSKENFKQLKYDTIVCPGGAMKGFMLMGAIQYLYDNSLLELKYYTGTSSSTIILFLMCIGYTPIEILVWVTNNKVIDTLSSKINSLFDIIRDNGLYDYDLVNNYLKNMCLEKTGSDVPTLKQLFDIYGKVFTTCTCNLSEGSLEYISYINHPNLSCLDAIRMSCNLPFIFGKYTITKGDIEHEYIDGGVLNNFPINYISEDSKKIIAINYKIKTTGISEGVNTNLSKIVDKMYKILNISINVREQEKNLCKYDDKIDLIIIDGTNISFFDLCIEGSKKVEMFSNGYNTAKDFYKNK